MAEMNDITWKFSMDMFNVLCKAKPKENVFLSPLSIMAALSMTMSGARGKTETELMKALHLTDANAKPLHNKIGSLLAGVANGNCTSLANRLFMEKTFDILSDFQSLLSTSYAAELGQVDFKKASAAAAKEINVWVEKNTGGRIKDLISPGDVDEDTPLILVNAIYFKGLWESPFKTFQTADLTFHVAPGKEIPMPLMTKRNESFFYSYSDEINCHCVKLPFQSEDLALYIIVPTKRFGLAEVETKLAANPGHLRELITNCFDTELELLQLPRFSIASEFALEGLLPELGINELFSRRCDLSGIAQHAPLCVSKVVHKAILEVSEEGAEAAAATAMRFETFCAMVMDTPTVVADHPFMVVLTHGENPLFVGRVAQPDAKAVA